MVKRRNVKKKRKTRAKRKVRKVRKRVNKRKKRKPKMKRKRRKRKGGGPQVRKRNPTVIGTDILPATTSITQKLIQLNEIFNRKKEKKENILLFVENFRNERKIGYYLKSDYIFKEYNNEDAIIRKQIPIQEHSNISKHKLILNDMSIEITHELMNKTKVKYKCIVYDVDQINNKVKLLRYPQMKLGNDYAPPVGLIVKNINDLTL